MEKPMNLIIDYYDLGIIISALVHEMKRAEKAAEKRIGTDRECVYEGYVDRVNDLYRSILNKLTEFTTNDDSERLPSDWKYLSEGEFPDDGQRVLLYLYPYGVCVRAVYHKDRNEFVSPYGKRHDPSSIDAWMPGAKMPEKPVGGE